MLNIRHNLTFFLQYEQCLLITLPIGYTVMHTSRLIKNSPARIAIFCLRACLSSVLGSTSRTLMSSKIGRLGESSTLLTSVLSFTA